VSRPKVTLMEVLLLLEPKAQHTLDRSAQRVVYAGASGHASYSKRYACHATLETLDQVCSDWFHQARP